MKNTIKIIPNHRLKDVNYLAMVDHLDVAMKCVYCSFQFRMRFSCHRQRLLCIVVGGYQVVDCQVGLDKWVGYLGDNLVGNLVGNLVVDYLVVDYQGVDNLGVDSQVEVVVVDVSQ